MANTIPCDYCGLPVPGSAAAQRRATEGISAALYCCYGCRFAAQVTLARGEEGHATWMLTRLGLAVFLSMGVMVFSMLGYGQDVYGGDSADDSSLAGALFSVMRYTSLILATPVFLLLGVPILAGAWEQLRARVVSTDALIMLGVIGALVYSYISTFADRGAVYYETACMILVLLTLGRYLEATGKLGASDAVRGLRELMPGEVALWRDGQMATVRAGEVRVGDVLLVRAGERCAADGVVEAGCAHVDEQMVTGESVPVEKSAGDSIHAGALATDGTLHVRASAVGADGTLARLIALLERARASKSPFERLADRLATLFVPMVVVLAVLGALLGFSRGGTGEAMMTFLAVLLIACPCALGIAAPLAVWVALGTAARRGILFRDGETLERLAQVRAAAFDKTGTLTTGHPTVQSVAYDPVHAGDTTTLLQTAAALAVGSTHALSRGIVAHAAEQSAEPLAPLAAGTVPGRGLEAVVDGAAVRLGSVAMMDEAGVRFSDALTVEVERIRAAGQGMACLGVGAEVAAVFSFAEVLRAEAKPVLDDLRRRGLEVTVLTGDHAARARQIGAALGIPVLAELTPADKVAWLEGQRARFGAVAMVGDGLNDAPALAAADVGIALGCGADLTRESAGVCLLADDLRGVPSAILLARRTVRTIRVNLFWAFTYNVAGIALALAGTIRPIVAAVAMVVSSLFVVGNSLRLRSDSDR